MLKLGLPLTMNLARLRLISLLARYSFPCSELYSSAGTKEHARRKMKTTPQAHNYTKNDHSDTWTKEGTCTNIFKHLYLGWAGQWTTTIFGPMAAAGVGFSSGWQRFDAEKGKEFMNLLAKLSNLTRRIQGTDGDDIPEPFHEKLGFKLIQSRIDKIGKFLGYRSTSDGISKHALAGGLEEGILRFIKACNTEIRRYNNKEKSAEDCAKTTLKQTGYATLQGASISGGVAWLERFAEDPAMGLGDPAVTVCILVYQANDIRNRWENGEMKTPEMKRACARAAALRVLSSGGIITAGAVLGPVGLIPAAGWGIVVGVGDYYLGDRFWKVIIPDNTDEKSPDITLAEV